MTAGAHCTRTPIFTEKKGEEWPFAELLAWPVVVGI